MRDRAAAGWEGPPRLTQRPGMREEGTVSEGLRGEQRSIRRGWVGTCPPGDIRELAMDCPTGLAVNPMKKMKLMKRVLFRELQELRGKKVHQNDYIISWNRSVKWTKKGRLHP